MTNIYELISKRLRAIDFNLDGRAPSESDIESLFRVDHRAFPRTSPLSLLPRLCEEHLTAALVTSRQAIEDRQAYLATGERFATLTLSLDSDEKAEKLLAQEADALTKRQEISNAAANAEIETGREIDEHFSQMARFSNSVDPSAAGPAGDAARNAWLSYINRGVNEQGYNTMAGYWGTSSHLDRSPSPGTPEYSMSPTEHIITLDSELTRRATLAAFRVIHERSFVEKRAAYTAVVASQGRRNTLTATVAFDGAAAAIATNRHTNAKLLLESKTAMTRDLALLNFKDQMELHRRRAQDLFLEAMERATAARLGLETVYGFRLPDIPTATTLETAEDLLFWCREVARILLGFDPMVAKQTLTISAQDSIGPTWRSDVALGATIDTKSLQDIGFVVRLRNVGVRFTGLRRAGFPIRVMTPRDVTDRDAQGTMRAFSQPASAIQLLATPASDQDVTVRRTAARVFHNLCPSGVWTLQATDLRAEVDDLLLDLDLSYLCEVPHE